MKKRPRIRNVLIILCVILAFVILLLVMDSYFKRDYTNPLRVAEAFEYSLMFTDKEHMKSWSCKKLYDKIDEIKPSQFLACLSEEGWLSSTKFNLVCFRRFNDTIVCTYALDNIFFNSVNEPLFYTVVLEPCCSVSIWEKVKIFVSWKIPFGENIFSYPYIKQRWLVIDFYSNDNLEEIYAQEMQRFKEWLAAMKGKPSVDFNEFYKKVEERTLTQLSRSKQWREQEKIEQNLQMRKLYQDLRGIENKTPF